MLIALAGCSAESSLPGDEIECALGAGAEFERVCTVERVQLEGEEQLVVHHPDGGFRRLIVLKAGKGVAPADGAGAVAQNIVADSLEVAIDGDRYRLRTKPLDTPPGE